MLKHSIYTLLVITLLHGLYQFDDIGSKIVEDLNAALATDFIAEDGITNLGEVAEGFFAAYKHLRDEGMLQDAVRIAKSCSNRLLITGHRFGVPL